MSEVLPPISSPGSSGSAGGDHDRPGFNPLAIVIGLILAIAGLLLLPTLDGSLKLPLVALLGLVGLCVLLVLPATLRMQLSIIGLALSIPFFVDKNFGYVAHTGGAPGLALSVADLVVGLLFILQWIERRQHGWRIRLDPRILAAPLIFMFIGVLTVLQADYANLIGFEFVRYCKLILFTVVVMNFRGKAQIYLFLVAMTIGVALEGGIAAAQYITGSKLGLGFFGESSTLDEALGGRTRRSPGTFGHPNILAYYFEMLIPLCLALAFQAKKGWHISWFTLALALGTVGMITTLSRGGWVTVPLTITGVLLFTADKRVMTMKGLAVVVIGLLGLAGVGAAAGPLIYKRFTGNDASAASSRAPLNRAAFSIIKQRPLLGVGWNNFSEVFKKYDKTGGSRIFRRYKHVVHNLHLWVWAEVGTFGLMAFWWTLMGPAVLAMRRLGRGPSWTRYPLVAIAAGLGAQMVHGLVDPGFKGMMNASILVFSLIGAIGCLLALQREDAMGIKGVVKP